MSKPFYERGLRFSCTRCSVCCRRDPGYVFLSRNDARLLASQLEIGYSVFVESYCRWVDPDGEGKTLSLREKANYDCILWDGGCTVYQNRPLQCRTFPFWAENLASPENWNRLDCPGINRGKTHTAAYIALRLEARGADPVLRSEP
ncbi:MAG: YkgJ family cysteine cluster protein [Treponema sp.]|nr:YkgJ family cysteine cluster protein [Treponema sp.]